MTTPPVPSGLAAQLAALLKLVAPVVAPIERIATGDGTIADDMSAANLVMDALSLLDPAQAPIMAEIEAAEPALQWLIQAYQSGAVSGGIPPWYPPGGGPDTIHHR